MEFGWAELLVIGVVALIVIGPKDLPEMFRTLGRFTAKARGMARDFSRAMEQAAKETGVDEVASDLKKVTSPKAMGLDAMKGAADRFEKWDPLKNAAKPTSPPPARPLTPPPMPPTPPAATPAPVAAAVAAPEPTIMGPATAALAEQQAQRKAIAAEAAEKLRAVGKPAAATKPAAAAPAKPAKTAAAPAPEPAAKPARKKAPAKAVAKPGEE
ncbi:MAG: Sec-independent protein translocase protein TatB [Fuscovulum sp.]|nr:MAG: Sec-independent protein translocase protein TatB [Fuscovulum sp.]